MNAPCVLALVRWHADPDRWIRHYEPHNIRHWFECQYQSFKAIAFFCRNPNGNGDGVGPMIVIHNDRKFLAEDMDNKEHTIWYWPNFEDLDESKPLPPHHYFYQKTEHPIGNYGIMIIAHHPKIVMGAIMGWSPEHEKCVK